MPDVLGPPAPAAPAALTRPRRRGLHRRVVEQLGLRIVRGELAPGAKLPATSAWATTLGVSRTALREAMMVLAGKGLIESRPRAGTRVRPREGWNALDPDVLAWRRQAGGAQADPHALFELRRIIEPAAAALAAERATAADLALLEEALADMVAAGDDGERFAEPDLRFHRTVLRMTGNELVGALGAMIEAALALTFRLSNDNPAGQSHAVPLHRAVASAIRARKPAAARAAMTILIDGAERDVRRALARRR